MLNLARIVAKNKIKHFNSTLLYLEVKPTALSYTIKNNENQLNVRKTLNLDNSVEKKQEF